MTTIFDQFKDAFDATRSDEMSLRDFLDLCKTDPMAYAMPAERMVHAIGDPKTFDTSTDQRFARLFGNRMIRTYDSFADFYGLEDTIEQIVNYFRHSAQGLEESKQLLYLLGPVGGGKSSLVDRLKELMEKLPIYVLAYKDPKLGTVPSPYFARPLPLFNRAGIREAISNEYNINPRYINGLIGPWEVKRLEEFEGDISKFTVVKMFPSRLNQIGIAVTEPGDENTQDVSTLTGKVDIRKLGELEQRDVDAYSFGGGLNRTNQGMLDFREMFKAKIKMLNPLLFAVQEHNYVGTENFGSIPYDGIVLAHSNESEWGKFRNNKENEAFLDRICIVKVPYCLRTKEEIQIYRKSIAASDLRERPIAPGTLEMLAQFAVLTRINPPQNSTIWSKMRVYNGENLKEKDPLAKAYHEYRSDPDNRTDGFNGASTRWCFKRISQTFNADPTEIAADAVHMRKIILDEIRKSDLSQDDEKAWIALMEEFVTKEFLIFLEKDIRMAYMESYSEWGQNIFDRYVTYASKWVDEEEHFDSATGIQMDKNALNHELEKIEIPAQITNPRDFRNEVVRYSLRYAKEHEGKNPDWRSYEKLRTVIEKSMFAKTDDILPVISFTAKGTDEERRKHNEFVQRMKEKGYTEKQVRRAVDFFQNNRTR